MRVALFSYWLLKFSILVLKRYPNFSSDAKKILFFFLRFSLKNIKKNLFCQTFISNLNVLYVIILVETFKTSLK